MRKLSAWMKLYVWFGIIFAVVAIARISYEPLKSVYKNSFYQRTSRQISDLIKLQQETNLAIRSVNEEMKELIENIHALMSFPTHTLVGMASWYGPGFEGKTTASGKPFVAENLTAAHPSLPLGTRVRVENLNNQKTVDVEITDRGPFHGERMLDLSDAAAHALGMKQHGTCPVKLTVLTLPSRR